MIVLGIKTPPTISETRSHRRKKKRPLPTVRVGLFWNMRLPGSRNQKALKLFNLNSQH